ncbi:hypothetical protein GYH30_055161 [Glycine max]|nr:hypothetical protein GYH30_055161 [Glycine max]
MSKKRHGSVIASSPSSKRPRATQTKRSPQKQAVEVNSSTRLKDLSETEEQKVDLLQRKENVTTQPPTPLTPKKTKVDKAPSFSKEPILASTMPKKMKNRETQANPVIHDNSWTPPTQGSSSIDTSSSESFISQ